MASAAEPGSSGEAAQAMKKRVWRVELEPDDGIMVMQGENLVVPLMLSSDRTRELALYLDPDDREQLRNLLDRCDPRV